MCIQLCDLEVSTMRAHAPQKKKKKKKKTCILHCIPCYVKPSVLTFTLVLCDYKNDQHTGNRLRKN